MIRILHFVLILKAIGCQFAKIIKSILAIRSTHVKMNDMDKRRSKNKAELPTHASYQIHRRQRLWQIMVPVLAGCLLTLAVAVWVVLLAAGVGSGVGVSQGADAAMIWIILPMLVLAVLMILVLIGLVIAFTRILKALPGYSRLAQTYVSMFAGKVQRASMKITAPIIFTGRVKAGAGALLTSIFGRSK